MIFVSQELFLNGNPADDWEGAREYVIHSLPQLKSYNGIEITRSDRIRAKQQFEKLEEYLRDIAPRRAEEVRRETERRAFEKSSNSETSEHAPEVRTEMYREIAEQKEQEENRKRENMPKERDYEREHEDTVEV